MKALASLFALFDWRSGAVLGRNVQVFLRNWQTAIIPPAMEPVVYFLAFGIGLATYVERLPYRGVEVAYGSWVAPGMMAFTVFTTAFYESLYSAYVRMFYQKTWDGILATQVELQHLIWGEVLWAALRGTSNLGLVILVFFLFDLMGIIDVSMAWALFALPLGFVAGAAFAAFGLIFTAVVPAIDHMNYPVFLIGLPLSFASHTYFPIEPESPVLRALVEANPLYHLAEAYRAMMVDGRLDYHVPACLGLSLLLLGVAYLAALRLTERRVVRES